MSMKGQKDLRFHQKGLHLRFKDEQKSYGFGTTWRWVLNDKIFIFRLACKKKFDKNTFSRQQKKYFWYLHVVTLMK